MEHDDTLVLAAASSPTTRQNDAFLADLDEKARYDTYRDKASNTQAAYKRDVAVWTEFCAAKGLDPQQISPGLLRLFVEWMDHEHQWAPSTMERRVYGVVFILRLALGPERVPYKVEELATQRIVAIARDLAERHIQRGRGPAEEITPYELRRLIYSQPEDTLIGLRNRTMLLMAGYMGNRISENVALRGSDITGDDTFLRIRVRRSKTGPKEVALSARPGNDLCPVAAWHRWRQTAQITDGPAFPRMDRHGNLHRNEHLSRYGASLILKRAAVEAGLSKRITGHTFRVFMATRSHVGGATVDVIAAQGGWKVDSKVLWKYIRRSEAEKNNATMYIDL